MPAIISGFSFYCISVSCITALEASERHYGLYLAVYRTSQTGAWDGWWVWPRHGTSKTKLQIHHSSTHMLCNIFRCGIWILRHFNNREANLGGMLLCSTTATVLNYFLCLGKLKWPLKHQALENTHVLPLPQDKDPLSQINWQLRHSPRLKALLWNSVPTLSHRPFTIYLMQLSQYQWPDLTC